jgi:hypothetical protein
MTTISSSFLAVSINTPLGLHVGKLFPVKKCAAFWVARKVKFSLAKKTALPS